MVDTLYWKSHEMPFIAAYMSLIDFLLKINFALIEIILKYCNVGIYFMHARLRSQWSGKI